MNYIQYYGKWRITCKPVKHSKINKRNERHSSLLINLITFSQPVRIKCVIKLHSQTINVLICAHVMYENMKTMNFIVRTTSCKLLIYGMIRIEYTKILKKLIQNELTEYI